MKKLLLIAGMAAALNAFAQPFTESLISNNLPDPTNMKVADLDGNGYDDMVVSALGGIAWFENLDGTNFSRSWLVDDLTGILDLEVLDYEGDTDLDVIGYSKGSSLIFLLTNDGSGNFTRSDLITSVPEALEIRAIDTDNDGDIDIFYSTDDSMGERLYLYENTGPGYNNLYLEYGDYDGDIHTLRAMATSPVSFVSMETSGTDYIAIYLNDGSNSFLTSKIIDADRMQLRDHQYVDMDNDGDSDHVFADYYNREIYWVEMPSKTKHVIRSNTYARFLAVDDFNNDGVKDVVFKNSQYADGTLYVYAGSNPGSSMTFTQEYYFSINAYIEGLEVGDFNNDNLPDFSYISTSSDGLVYHLNNGSFSFTPVALARNIVEPDLIRETDLDEDGDMDVVAYDASEILIWFENDGAGKYTEHQISTSIDRAKQLEVEDMDGDGDKDIVSASISDDDFVFWENDGSENFTRNTITYTSSQLSNPSYFAIADLDGDMDKDMAVVASALDFGNPVGIFWLRNEGSGSFSSPIEIESGLELTQQVRAEDFDGDGDMDLVVTGDATYGEGLLLQENDGSGNFTNINLDNSLDCFWLRTADIDGDSDMDFAVNDGSSNIIWYENTGNMTFAPHTITTGETDGIAFELLDTDGDTDVDIFYYTYYSGSTNIQRFNVGYYENDGSENFTKNELFTEQYNISSMLPVDRDNDSDLDFYWGSDYLGKISFYENGINDLVEPTISSWPAGTSLTYGQQLSGSTLSGGSASVAGQFGFKDPDIIPDAGSYAAAVEFVPDDGASYKTVQGTVTIPVDKADPSITTWPAAGDLTYGQTLSEIVFTGGSTSVPGIFTFDNGTTILSTGTSSEAVTFTPADVSNYNAVAGSVSVTILKATPVVSSWPTAAAITYGEALSASILTGGIGDVPGTFSFVTPSAQPDAGTHTADLAFTPADGSNYNVVSGTVDVTVNKAIPVVSAWPSPSDITYGETLADVALTGAVVDAPGTFVFDAPGTQPDAGVYVFGMTFIPDSPENYEQVQTTLSVTILQAIPEVTTWPTAEAIQYGEPLSASTLTGGAADVAGTFSFDSPTDLPDAGITTAPITFTPGDASNYETVAGTIDVTVNKADQSISWEQDLEGLTVDQVVVLNAASSAGLEISYSSSDNAVATINGDELTITGEGVVTLTASQAGDANHHAADDVEQIITIETTGLQPAVEFLELKVYPVPASEWVELELSGAVMEQVGLYDFTGRNLAIEKPAGEFRCRMELKNLVPGTYILRVETAEGIIMKRFIKE